MHSLAPRLRSTARFALVASVCACAAPQQQKPQQVAPLPPPSSSANGAKAEAVPVEAHGVRLTPQPSPALAPHVELVEPAFGDLLDARLARSAAVRLRVEGVVAKTEGEGVLLALDGQRPRRWTSERALTLGELLPLDAEILPGAHSLLAVAVAADGRALRGEGATHGRPVSLVTFFVGARPSGTASPASLFCLSPQGTRYAPAGAPVPLEVFAFGSKAPTRVRVRAGGQSFELPFDASRTNSLEGLPFGDVVLEVGEPGGPSSVCAVTLNPPLEARP